MGEIIHILRIAAATFGGGLLGFCLVCSVYLFAIVLVGFLARRKPSAKLDTSHSVSFAVLIPAHDEELLIAQTAQSVKAIKYPNDKFSVFVVADNCTDATALRAAEAGATV